MEDMSERRNKLYSTAIVVSIIFAIVFITVLALFKLNEEYLAGNGQLGLLTDTAVTKESQEAYPKINIKVDFSDGADKSLVIPLTFPVDLENISVREEFTENKYVILLSGYGEYITGDISLTGDLDIMKAAGAYVQNENAVVEVYCNGNYDYEVLADESSVTVKFHDLSENYDYKAVVWMPFSDKDRLNISDLKTELTELAREDRVKLYLTSELENEYSQSDIIDFANGINADMVIGIVVEASENEASGITGICNTSYYMPDYDSARLAVNLVEGFVYATDYEVTEFMEADENYPLVSEATVPAAAVIISAAESEKKIDENIIYAIENTINSVMAEWRQ